MATPTRFGPAAVAAAAVWLAAGLAAGGEAGGASPAQPAPAVPAGEFSLPENRWTKIAEVPPDPLGRELEPGRGAFLCHEPVSGKFLRYGGCTPTDCNALWTFDLAARKWENPLKVDYTWPPPADRPGAGAWWSMAHDGKRKVVWFFGGWGLAGRTHPELLNDVWRYDVKAGKFEAVKSKGSPGIPIDGLPMVYDSKNDLLIAAPIARLNPRWDGAVRGKTLVYDPNRNSWEQRDTKTMPMRVRYGPNVFVYAPCIGKAVFLENDEKGGPAATWTYDAAANAWAKLNVAESPPGRVVAGSAYDAASRLVIVYGGVGHGKVGGSSATGYLDGGSGTPLEDTWALDPSKPEWRRLDVGAPGIPKLPGQARNRFEIVTAMDYDAKHRAVVLAAPTVGVWALRYRPEPAPPLPELRLARLPAFAPAEEPERVFPLAPENEKLLRLPPNKWVELGGGRRVGGNEVPVAYDESTGLVLSYGGCSSGGTTFSAGYGNPLSAYDPATERWIALRWYDVCGPPRPANGCNQFMAYDTKRGRTWHHGGTAQNQLGRSVLPGWAGGPFVWSYHGLRDRFEMVPVKAPPQMGNGVITGYDPGNDLFVIYLGGYWKHAFGFSPGKAEWRQLGERREAGYSMACYVGSLKGLFMTASGRPVLFDAASGQVRDLPSKGDLPPDGDKKPLNAWVQRSSSAYDPETDTVLSIGCNRTSLYDVKTGVWKNLGSAPGCGFYDNHLAYDSRHKVFLLLPGMARNAGVHAFRPVRE